MTAPVEIVRNARARRARLSVDPASGRVRLTLPLRAPVKAALRWAAEQQPWIAAQRARLPVPRPFLPGGTIPYGDGALTIDWRENIPRRIERDGDFLRCGGPADGLARRVETWLKREALRVLGEETAEFAGRAGVEVAKVTIGDPRARWGSCTAAGAIRYSWRADSRACLCPAVDRRARGGSPAPHEPRPRIPCADRTAR